MQTQGMFFSSHKEKSYCTSKMGLRWSHKVQLKVKWNLCQKKAISVN
jgi:hypothetical protein